ncbi:hypothetical protein VTJ83DRAFT_875 [Remersonia thermophila]|uniref:Rhodopsin domain-containing protein n=1 Tax=Remersonia thermophila TaxID=72144 RepID=A0ABR4DN25_9PEZI
MLLIANLAPVLRPRSLPPLIGDSHATIPQHTLVCHDKRGRSLSVMGASSSLLDLLASPAGSGLQAFALFVNFFFPALALIVVSIRVARRVSADQFAVDDWLVCIAMLMSAAETVVSFFFIKTNFIGIPPERVPPHDPTPGLVWSYAVQILYNPILALVKSSVLIFLGRLFDQKNWIRRLLLWLNVVNISQMAAVFFAILFQCTPVAFNWDLSIPGGRCVDRRALYILTAAFNIVMDILILGIPLWIFSKLRIPARTKIALLVIFTLGFLVTITSIIRLVLLVRGLFMVPIFPHSDPGNVGFVTSAIETNLALITASAPALRPIFRSRDRGGWFARTVVATIATNTTRGSPDNYTIATAQNDPFDLELEKGLSGQRPFGWRSDKETWGITKASTSSSSTWPRATNSTSSSSSSRPLSRSRSQSRTRLTRRGTAGSSSSKIKPTIKLIRNVEPEVTVVVPQLQPPGASVNASNPGMRVSDIQREIDGIVKDIAAAGKGTYTGIKGSTMSSSTPTTAANMAPRLPTIPAKQAPQPGLSTTTTRPTTPKTPKTPKTPRTPQPRPSIETVTVGVTQVTPLPPRPSTSASTRSAANMTINTSPNRTANAALADPGSATRTTTAAAVPPERYYSMSIYDPPTARGAFIPTHPVPTVPNEDEDDWFEADDRVSRYLDRRFGVVTPRGTTPTARGWEGSGRPF